MSVKAPEIAAALSVVISTAAAIAVSFDVIAAFTVACSTPFVSVKAPEIAAALSVVISTAAAIAVSFEVMAASTVSCSVPDASVNKSAFAYGVSSAPPHAASDKAIKDTPPARAALEFLFSHAAVNVFNNSACVFVSSALLTKGAVEIMFILYSSLNSTDFRLNDILRKLQEHYAHQPLN